MPERMTDGAAGLDCFARERGFIWPHERRLVPLGFQLEIPVGWCAHILPRSGLALRHSVVEFVGTIDSDYRGEVSALLFHHGGANSAKFSWYEGQSLCQIVFRRVEEVRLVAAEELSETSRGAGGFGSTDADHLKELYSQICPKCGRKRLYHSIVDGSCL